MGLDSSSCKISINRRSLLAGLGAIAVSSFLSGCGSSPSEATIALLRGTIPAQLIDEFQRQLKASESSGTVSFAAKTQISDLFNQLVQQASVDESDTTSGNSMGHKLVALGDSWLQLAIQRGLLQPFSLDDDSAWSDLPEAWQLICQRNQQGLVDPDGQIWAIPYRWGSLMLVYNTAAFQDLDWLPEDWDALWHSDMRGRVSLLDSPRAVIGLTLKKLGLSFSEKDLDSVAELQPELAALRPQIKLFSSDTYLQPVLLGDTWLAIGWSTDVLPLVARDRRASAVIPASGTSLFADVWVRPAQASSSEADNAALQDWINFCWQPDIAERITELTRGASPMLVEGDRRQNLPAPLQANDLLLPSPDLLDRCEFLYPLNESAIAQYQQIWNQFRRVES